MVNITNISALITAVAVLLSASAAILAALSSSRNGHRIMEVKLSLNSRLDQLVEVNRRVALMEGHIAGIAFEKAEQEQKGKVDSLNKADGSTLKQQRNKHDLHQK